ncbi:MAG: hypothetical protein NC433_01775 [Clostridiales bacterium]|nr:hypothetical protein [Clostridiales bacterium]
MLLLAIELDEERIKKENLVRLDIANKIIENAFKEENCFIYKQMGNMKFWTRNADDDRDLEALWLVQSAFKKEAWFRYYVKVWKLIIVNDYTKKITYQEDIISQWIPERPDKP